MHIHHESSYSGDSSRQVRCKNNYILLLPNLLCPLAVDPGIPADFVALSPNGILDPYDFIYWGPKNVLIAYFKDPSSLKVPLIRVKLSEMVAQTGPNSFHKSFMEYLKKLRQEDPKGFASIE
jgi:hypothetical protein